MVNTIFVLRLDGHGQHVGLVGLKSEMKGYRPQKEKKINTCKYTQFFKLPRSFPGR